MSARPAKALEGELLERAVHDLKNPLSVVRASLEWLEVELADREDALDAVRDAAAATERLLTIADDLDALARLDREGVSTHDSVPVVAMVNAVVASASAQLAHRKIAVEARVRRTGSAGTDPSPRSAAERPLEIRSNERLLRRSLSALVDATARGAPAGACIEVSVAQVALASEGRAIEIGFALRGTIDPAGLPGSLDALTSGGLGVYVALRVVEAHRGSLEVVPTASLPRIVIRLPC